MEYSTNCDAYSSPSPLPLGTVVDDPAAADRHRDDLGVQPHRVSGLPPAARLALPRAAARQRRPYLRRREAKEPC